LNSTRLGPVGDPYTVSPSGSGRCSFQNNAATIYTIASTGAMLLYRAETRQSENAALAAEPCCVPDFNGRLALVTTTCAHSFWVTQPPRRGGPCSFRPISPHPNTIRGAWRGQVSIVASCTKACTSAPNHS